jgi:hypothetical protein
MRRLFRFGAVPSDRQDDHVLLLNLSFRPQRVPENLPAVLYYHSIALIRELPQANSGDATVLEQAAQILLHVTNVSLPETYNYYGAQSPLHYGLLLYAIRIESILDPTDPRNS